MADALARFTPRDAAGKKPRFKSAENTKIAGGAGWFLEVRGTGEWIRFRHNAYIDSKRNPRLPVDQRPAPARLEARARELVANELAPFITLRAGEELRGWVTQQLVSGSIDESGASTKEVLATRVIFTRVIDKIPVLGPGGKVAVIMANDGTLAGFDIDWPELKPMGNKVRTVGIDTILQRKNQLLGSGPNAPALPERAFTCGYYDPGAAGASTSTRIGPACEVVFESPDSGPLPKIIVPINAN